LSYTYYYSKPKLSQIFSFSSDNPEGIKEVFSKIGNYQVIGKDPASNRILLVPIAREGECEIIVLNLDTNNVEKNLRFQSTCTSFERSTGEKK
jgi:hypothetical protein